MTTWISSLGAVAVTVMLPAIASAQVPVPPVTTGSTGYLFPNDKYQRERQERARTNRTPSAETRERTTPRARTERAARPADAPIELDAAAQARVRAAVQALVPEYHQRASRDGEASANAWIKQQAFVIGQREGDIARRNSR